MKHLVLILILPLVYLAGFGQDATKRMNNFNLDKGIGIRGYDPVAYFIQDKAVRGNKDLSVSYEGITYYFANAADKDEFKKNPSRYEPQYGGWCAYAMGNDGSRVEIDPETFKIINGKLFLFYNKFFNNTLKSWNKSESALHQQADANWLTIYH
jgi:YHS domain-containing protein